MVARVVLNGYNYKGIAMWLLGSSMWLCGYKCIVYGC